MFTELRKQGVRRLVVDGKPVDLADDLELDGSKVKELDAIVDRFVVRRRNEKVIKAGVLATLLVGDGLMRIEVVKGASRAELGAISQGDDEREAPRAVRRRRSGVLRLQPSRERMPHVRRTRRAQAHASRAAHPRSDAQHRRRLFRARRIPLQPGQLGRATHLQSVAGDGFFDRDAVGEAAGAGAQRDALWPRGEVPSSVSSRREGQASRVGRQGRRIPRHRATHRAALSTVSPARRGQLGNGGVARPRDGGARVPGLSRFSAPCVADVVHCRGQNVVRRRPASL